MSLESPHRLWINVISLKTSWRKKIKSKHSGSVRKSSVTILTDRGIIDHPVQKEKTEAEIHAEIQAIIRQITASVTFLPMLEGRCTFNVLVYADSDANVPDEEWGDSDAKEVKNAENVKLRSFSTMNHRIDTMVSYRLDAEDY
jgi:mitotic spindle assembly checkpoint protein MAD2